MHLKLYPIRLMLGLMVANAYRPTRKFYSHAGHGECVDSGLKTADHKTIYTPRHCIPTTCKVTTSNGAAVNGFNCTIGNGERSPTACFNFRKALATSGGDGRGPSCPSTLARINRYVFTCDKAPYGAVSLNFTFDLPTCGRTISGPHDAVMAVFSARNETTDRYFTTNPICRVFSFGSNDLRHFAPDKSVLVQYDCIAMGLQTAYPKVLYYLTLTTFPWGDVVNYTIVYLAHASEGSMQVVAGAWLPGRRIHVVFVTTWGATAYRVQARGGEQVFFSEKVPSSSPSVEIGNIPPQAHTVIVKVEAVEWEFGQCPSFHKVCAPIEVMLHDTSQLNLSGRPQPVKGNEGEGDAEKTTSAVETGVIAVAAIAAAAAVTAFILVAVCKWRPCAVPGKQLHVLVGNSAPQGEATAMAGKVVATLRKRGFVVTEAFPNDPDPCGQEEETETTPQPALLRCQDVILLVIHPAARDAQRRMQGLVRAIFQMALVARTRVVSLADDQGNHLQPSEAFLPALAPLQSSRSGDFLQSLDRATFYLPGEWDKLAALLKELSRPRGSSKTLGFFPRWRRETAVGYDRERDGVDLSALLESSSASGDCVSNGELRQGGRGSVGGETCSGWGSSMEANGGVSGHQQRQNTVRVEAQVHPACEGGPCSVSIEQETGSSSRMPCPVHSAAFRRASVDIGRRASEYRGRQRREETGVVSDPWTYGGCGRPPLSACDTSPQPGVVQGTTPPAFSDQRRIDDCDPVQEDPPVPGHPSDSSRSPDMFIHSRDDAVLPSSGDGMGHSCSATPLLDPDTEVKHPPSPGLAPFRRQYSVESEIPSSILSAPTLSSVLSSEHRRLPEGSEDQAACESAGDRDAQSCREETDVKSLVPSAPARSERREVVEGGERGGQGQPSPQSRPEDVPASASSSNSGSQSGVGYQQSSWPSQCRPVPEGESLPKSRPHGSKSKVQSHAPVAREPVPAEYCARHSELSPWAPAHDSHSRSSRTAVGESPEEQRPVRDASRAPAAADTFVPKYPPVGNWSQRIDRDRRSSDRLARTSARRNGGYVARPPCDIDRPWLVGDMPANGAMDSVDRVAQELFDVPHSLGSGAAGPGVAGGQHSEPGAFAGAENGRRFELREAPPGAGVGGRFCQMNGSVNAHGHLDPVNGHGHPVNGHGHLGPVNGHGQFGPVNGHGHLDPVNGQGHLDPVNGHGRFGPVNGHGHLDPVYGHGHFGPVNGHGHFDPVNGHGHLDPVNGHGHPVNGRGHPVNGHGHPVNGHGHLDPVNGHGHPGWGREGFREFPLACRNEPVENGESSSSSGGGGGEQCSGWRGRNGSGGNGALAEGQGGLGEFGHLGFARPEPVEDTESSSRSVNSS